MGLIAFAFGAWICGVALSGASGAAADGAAPAGLVGRDIGVPQTATGLPILGRSVASTVQKRACPGNTKSCTISGTAYCVPTNYTCCATTLCGPGQTCGSNGICLGTCAQTTCPLASGGSACVDISIDYRACGGCGKTCGQPMGGFGYCEDGKCMVACDPGFAHQNGSCIQVSMQIASPTIPLNAIIGACVAVVCALIGIICGVFLIKKWRRNQPCSEEKVRQDRGDSESQAPIMVDRPEIKEIERPVLAPIKPMRPMSMFSARPISIYSIRSLAPFAQATMPRPVTPRPVSPRPPAANEPSAPSLPPRAAGAPPPYSP